MRRTIRTVAPSKVTRRPAAVVNHKARGKVYDLQKIFNKLNRCYFDNTIVATIKWGHRLKGKPRKHKSIRMGAYSTEDKVICIHRALDRKEVPAYFVEYVVFHEMLHQKLPIPTRKGRRQFHTPDFMANEATFKYFAQAQQWEKENLDSLLLF